MPAGALAVVEAVAYPQRLGVTANVRRLNTRAASWLMRLERLLRSTRGV